MFDLGWDEMAVIAVVALVVLGPKELPNALRTVMSLTKAARKLAGEFQSGVNEIIREADLEETKKKLTELQSINKNTIQRAVEKAVDPTGDIKSAMKIDETPAVNLTPPVIESTPAGAPTTAPAIEAKTPAAASPAATGVVSPNVESADAQSPSGDSASQKDSAA